MRTCLNWDHLRTWATSYLFSIKKKKENTRVRGGGRDIVLPVGIKTNTTVWLGGCCREWDGKCVARKWVRAHVRAINPHRNEPQKVVLQHITLWLGAGPHT